MTVRRYLRAAVTGALVIAAVAPGRLFGQISAELPRRSVDTTLVAPSGRTIAVQAGHTLQSALDAAVPGDVITLQAGATFVGPFTLPNKPGSGWITVRTSAPDSALPPPGTRVTPHHSAVMPKIITRVAASALRTAPGAHHFRFIGVEFTLDPRVTFSYDIVSLGDVPQAGQRALDQVPHHLIFDRCYIHGLPNGSLQRGITTNSATTAIIDSHISEIHGNGLEAQAIGGWNGPGPFKIVNNYLEGAGENIMFGGADAAGPAFVPADIEIRRNHLFKPLSWQIGHPSYAGIPWTVKNSFELKLARRVLIEGNVFENSWRHAQEGTAIVLTPRNQEGGNPFAVVEDVTIQHNIVTNATGGVIILGRDWPRPSLQASRLTIRNNLFHNVGGGRLFQLVEATADVVIEQNTQIGPPPVYMLLVSGGGHSGFVYRNNIAMHGQHGFLGDATSAPGGLTVLAELFSGGVFAGNIVAMDGAPPGIDVAWATARYPRGNFFVPSLADVHLLANGALADRSPYRRRGTGARDPGIDADKVAAATQGVVITGAARARRPDSPR